LHDFQWHHKDYNKAATSAGIYRKIDSVFCMQCQMSVTNDVDIQYPLTSSDGYDGMAARKPK